MPSKRKQTKIIGPMSHDIRKKSRGTGQTNCMSGESFAHLKEAVEGALAFERGERRDLHVTRIRARSPPKVASPKGRRTFGA